MSYKYTDQEETRCINTITGSNHAKGNWTWRAVKRWLAADPNNEIEAYRTQSELDQDSTSKLIRDRRKLKRLFAEYEQSVIDHSMSIELTLSRALIEARVATKEDLPAAKATRQWIKRLYGSKSDEANHSGSYHSQRKSLIAGEQPTYKFDDMPTLDYDFYDLSEEREEFLNRT